MKVLSRAALTVTTLALVLTGACSSASPGPDASPSPTGRASHAAAAVAAATTPKVTKLLVVVEENHSLAQMKAGMPYTFRLAKRYGYATGYDAITHPSLPNYIAIAGGKTYGIDDDADPAAHQLGGRSVFGQAIANDRTAATYAQGMPSRCALTSSGDYAVRHNPWTYFVEERAQCRKHDLRMSRFAGDVTDGDLPRVGMVIPDLAHDAHDGTLKKADGWFKALMTQVFQGPDWTSGHLAVVLTADEDDRNHGNRVLTVVIHPSQSHHVVKARLDHYSLTRLYDDVAQLPYLHRAKGAASMTEAFGLPVR
ncbi:alkaline phosphatase family protein [Nocardioides sp. LS1]|uniref:alkaline phosphatase family protein n=1 Tax=Nocardioides sp. LS1 TaxID=1027620 RepID=UPI000F6280FF|nr:alkaline phosphatase family protein [Nocardioides sp. LS1]GCD88545.1 acid phosphatase [Nocardioides sp. LS1]